MEDDFFNMFDEKNKVIIIITFAGCKSISHIAREVEIFFYLNSNCYSSKEEECFLFPLFLFSFLFLLLFLGDVKSLTVFIIHIRFCFFVVER